MGGAVPCSPKRACPVCRVLHCSDPAHLAVRQRNINRQGSPEDKARRQALIVAWVGTHGWVCPGYGVPAHESHDLTADHIAPIGRGGDPLGRLQVLCRSCNSRRNAMG